MNTIKKNIKLIIFLFIGFFVFFYSSSVNAQLVSYDRDLVSYDGDLTGSDLRTYAREMTARGKGTSTTIPANYQSLSRREKIVILREIISNIQNKIKEIIRRRALHNNKLPFGTKVILKYFDNDFNSDITEQGDTTISYNFKDLSSSENGYFNVLLKDLKYKFSIKTNNEFDFHLSGKNSFTNYSETGSVNSEYTFKDDYFSVDIVYYDDTVFIKIDGFKKLWEVYTKKVIASMNEYKISNKEIERVKKEIMDTENFTDDNILNHWIKIPLEQVRTFFYGNSDLDFNISDEILKDILKVNYIKDDFIVFENTSCNKSNTCLSNTSINFDKLQKFIEDTAISLSKETGEKITAEEKQEMHKEFTSFSKLIKKVLIFKMKILTLANKNIVKVESLFKLKMNEGDIREYLSEDINENFVNGRKFNFELKINDTDNIKYVATIRNIKDFTLIEKIILEFFIIYQ